MFKPMSRLKYFCGLDIGVFGIKASLVRVQDEQNLDLLGVFELRSTGFKDGSVSDLTELGESVKQAVQGVSQKFGVKVSSVHLGISSEVLTVRRSSAVIPLIDSGTKVINRGDLKKVNHQARLLGTGLEEEVIHEFPQLYKVDDLNAALSPVGMYGRKLESNLLLLLANTNRLRNIVKAVHQGGLEVSRISLSSYAASEMALSAQQKAEGCVLIDIGANMTTVLLFKQGILMDIQSIPWGGHYLTRHLAERLSISLELAEEIKKTHAMAVENAAAARGAGNEILVKRDKDYLPLRREAVCEAVNWEIENLLTHLETVIKGAPMFHELNRGVVMVGGGALLAGLLERIEKRLSMPVELGATKGLNHAALFAGAIGLAQMSHAQNLKDSFSLKTPSGWKNNVLDRLRELCQEYF